MTIEELQAPVQNQFLQFKEEYKVYTQSNTPLLQEVEDFLAQVPGKQIRPLLLLLSAQACGHLSHHHILLATAMELLHNATLMHDDVVDESDFRRGKESIRRHWGNQVAVLCGDYYLSQVMMLLQSIGNSEASNSVAKTVAIMSQGELKQLSALSNNNFSTNTYLDIIGSKTASLMALCCELGAMNLADGNGNDYRKTMYEYGYHYGMVFQMRDDLADTHSSHDIGFPKGFDVHEQISEYTKIALQSLVPLPASPAKEALGKLLLPSSPSPANS